MSAPQYVSGDSDGISADLGGLITLDVPGTALDTDEAIVVTSSLVGADNTAPSGWTRVAEFTDFFNFQQNWYRRTTASTTQWQKSLNTAFGILVVYRNATATNDGSYNFHNGDLGTADDAYVASPFADGVATNALIAHSATPWPLTNNYTLLYAGFHDCHQDTTTTPTMTPTRGTLRQSVGPVVYATLGGSPNNSSPYLRETMQFALWDDNIGGATEPAVSFNFQGAGSGGYNYEQVSRLAGLASPFSSTWSPDSTSSPLSTVATIDHDVLTGVEEDQHHARLHALAGPEHVLGFLVKQDSFDTAIFDSDFTIATPVNGMIAMTYNTVSGRKLVWLRAGGTWDPVEVA